jgi:hypothetical protein
MRYDNSDLTSYGDILIKLSFILIYNSKLDIVIIIIIMLINELEDKLYYDHKIEYKRNRIFCISG